MKIQVINKSTALSQEDAAVFTAACQAQAANEFAAAWEIKPPVIEFAGDNVTDPDAYQMFLMDRSTDPGALGYHDVDENGRWRGFVFVLDTTEAGLNVSTTLSHEILEMLKDPSCTLWHQTSDGNMRALEMCDAVEADEYTKNIGGRAVTVSNFVLPNYFTDQTQSGPTDFLNKLEGQPAPARTAGGYDIVVDTTGQPSQEFSRHMRELPEWRVKLKDHPYSRTNRRSRGFRRVHVEDRLTVPNAKQQPAEPPQAPQEPQGTETNQNPTP